ncbi:hypothetical protein SNE40_000608 [Patella caerulea]|uniref:Poly [ADP-ribose] polymerase n=1 Tax=Patella caerulea TaxID=87958 RepID=A0AAN8Q2G1_PATCE
MDRSPDVDENGLYTYRSRPTTPRSSTPDIEVRIRAVSETSPCIKDGKFHFNSQCKVFTVRRSIESYFGECFENGFVFLSNRNEVLKAQEKDLKLVDILPKLPRFSESAHLNKHFYFEDATYKELNTSNEGERKMTVCVCLLFLYADSGLSHWNRNDLWKRLGAHSLKTFTFVPSSILSAKPSVTESLAEEINKYAVYGKMEEIGVFSNQGLRSNPKFADYRGATPLHYAAKNGDVKLCEYLMINFENEIMRLRDSKDSNGRNALNYLLTFLSITVTKAEYGSSSSLQSTSGIKDSPLNKTNHTDVANKKSSAKTKNKSQNKIKESKIGVKLTKHEKEIPEHTRNQLDVIIYLLTQKFNLDEPDILGISCSDRLQLLPSRYLLYLLKRLDPNYIPDKVVLHLADVGLQLMHHDKSFCDDYVIKYFDVLPFDHSYILPPLHLATHHGKEHFVRKLLERSHDHKKKDATGMLAFHHACKIGNRELVKLLYFEEMENSDFLQGLKIAFEVCCRKYKSFEVFEDVYSMRKPYKLNMASEFAELIVKCMENNIDVTQWIHILPFLGENIRHRFLSQGSYLGCYEVVYHLVKLQVNVNVKDFMGRTALHEAMYTGRYEIVKYLISAKANPNVQDDRRSTPLHYACQCVETNELYTLNGKRVFDGRTCSKKTQERVIQCMDNLITDGGADLSISDINGRTPILVALHHKRYTIFKWLLDKHLDKIKPFSVDHFGFHILHYLAEFTDNDLNFILEKVSCAFKNEITKAADTTEGSWLKDVDSMDTTGDYWCLPDGEDSPQRKIPDRIRLCRLREAFVRKYETQPNIHQSQYLLKHLMSHSKPKIDSLLKTVIEALPTVRNSRIEMFLAGMTASRNWDMESLRIILLYGEFSESDLSKMLFAAVTSTQVYVQEWDYDPKDGYCVTTISNKHLPKQNNLVQYLLSKGASPNIFFSGKEILETDYVHILSPYGKFVQLHGSMTVLEVAVMQENLHLVESLLVYATVFGCFAAHIAALNGNVPLLKLLLKTAQKEMNGVRSNISLCKENEELISLDILRAGILKAACCSAKPAVSLFKCMFKYFPEIVNYSKYVNYRMISNIVNPGCLFLCGFNFKSASPITALLRKNASDERRTNVTQILSYLMEKGVYMKEIRVRKKKNMHMHGACESLMAAMSMKLWECVNIVLERTGNTIWKCLMSKSESCHRHNYSSAQLVFHSCFDQYFNEFPTQTLQIVLKGVRQSLKTNGSLDLKQTLESEMKVEEGYQQELDILYLEYLIRRVVTLSTAFEIILIFPELIEKTNVFRDVCINREYMYRLKQGDICSVTLNEKLPRKLHIPRSNLNPITGDTVTGSDIIRVTGQVNQQVIGCSHLEGRVVYHGKFRNVQNISAGTRSALFYYPETPDNPQTKENGGIEENHKKGRVGGTHHSKTDEDAYEFINRNHVTASIANPQKIARLVEKLNSYPPPFISSRSKQTARSNLTHRKRKQCIISPTKDISKRRACFPKQKYSSVVNDFMILKIPPQSVMKEKKIQTFIGERRKRFNVKPIVKSVSSSGFVEKLCSLTTLQKRTIWRKKMTEDTPGCGRRNILNFEVTNLGRFFKGIPANCYDEFSRLSLLHYIALCGDVQLMSYVLVTSGTSNLNKDVNGIYPINMAASVLDLKMVEFLMDKGAKIQDSTMLAACMGDSYFRPANSKFIKLKVERQPTKRLEIVKYLLNKGCSPLFQDTDYGNCLDWSIFHEDWELTDVLLRNNIPINLTMKYPTGRVDPISKQYNTSSKKDDSVQLSMQNSENHDQPTTATDNNKSTSRSFRVMTLIQKASDTLCSKTVVHLSKQKDDLTPSITLELMDVAARRKTPNVLRDIFSGLVLPLVKDKKHHMENLLHPSNCHFVIKMVTQWGLDDALKEILSKMTHLDDFKQLESICPNLVLLSMKRQHWNILEMLLLNGLKTRERLNIDSKRTGIDSSTKWRLQNLLRLSTTAANNGTTLLHAAAAGGNREVMLDALHQPLGHVYTHALEQYPGVAAALNHQNETYALCLEKGLFRAPEKIQDTYIISFLTTFIDIPRFLNKCRLSLNPLTDSSGLYTRVWELFQSVKWIKPSSFLSIENSEDFLQRTLQKEDLTENTFLVLAMLGNCRFLKVLESKFHRNLIRKRLEMSLLGTYSFIDLLLIFSVSSSSSKDEDRSEILNYLISLSQLKWVIAPLTLQLAARHDMSHLLLVILKSQTLSSSSKSDLLQYWVPVLYRAISNGDEEFTKAFWQAILQDESDKETIIHTCIGIAIIKGKDALASSLVKLYSIDIDIMKQFILPWTSRRSTCILECFGLCSDVSRFTTLFESLIKNRNVDKEHCKSICKTGSINMWKLISDGSETFSTIFEYLSIAAKNGHEKLCIELFGSGEYLTQTMIETEISKKEILHLACRYNMIDFIEMILKKMDKSKIRETLLSPDAYGFTPLDYAKLFGHIKLYLDLQSKWEVSLTIDNHHNYRNNVGFFSYLMGSNKSTESNVPNIMTLSKPYYPLKFQKRGKSDQTKLDEYIIKGDQVAVWWLINTEREILVSDMKRNYEDFPYFHLLATYSFPRALQSLISYCEKYVPEELKIWLNTSLSRREDIFMSHYTPLTASLEFRAFTCFPILWETGEGREVTNPNNDTILHHAVAMGDNHIINMVNEQDDSIRLRQTKNAQGYNPAMIAALLGRHDIVPLLIDGLDFESLITDHSEHDIFDHVCLLCTFDLCIGWSNIYQKSLNSPGPDLSENNKPIRNVWNPNERVINHPTSLKTVLGWVEKIHPSLKDKSTNKEGDKILKVTLGAMGFNGGSQYARLILMQSREAQPILGVPAYPGMDDIACEMIKEHDVISAEVASDVIRSAIQYNCIQTIKLIGENYKDILINPANESLMHAISLGNMKLVAYIINLIQQSGTNIDEHLTKLSEIKEAIPLPISLVCGYRKPGDEKWDSETNRISDSDGYEISTFIMSDLRNIIDSYAIMESIIPSVMYGKEINVDMATFERQCPTIPGVVLRRQIVVHILQRYPCLISFDTDAWKQIECIRVICTTSSEPTLVRQDNALLDTVQMKSGESGSIRFNCSSAPPGEISFAGLLKMKIVSDVIPDLEERVKEDLEIDVNIRVNWSTIQNQALPTSALLTVMEESVWSRLGGLESVLHSCSLYMEFMKDHYPKDMVGSVKSLLKPVKEIEVRYVKTLSSSGRQGYGKLGSVILWEFAISDGHLQYDSEAFPLYEILRTCYIAYNCTYGEGLLLSQTQDEYNIFDFQKITMGDEFILDLDMLSFDILGRSARKYFAHSLRQEISSIAMARNFLCHIPLPIKKLVIKNSPASSNCSLSYSRTDRNLLMNVHATKTSNPWGLATIDYDRELSKLERDQVLQGIDVPSWYAAIESAIDTLFFEDELPVKLVLTDRDVKDLIVLSRVAGLPQRISSAEAIAEWIHSACLRFMKEITGMVDFIFQNYCNCWALGNFKIPSGLWQLVTEENISNDESGSIFLKLENHPSLDFKLENNTSHIQRNSVCWRFVSFDKLGEMNGDGPLCMVSFNGLLYFSPDKSVFLAILKNLPKEVYPHNPSAKDQLKFTTKGYYSKDVIHESSFLRRCRKDTESFCHFDNQLFILWQRGLKNNVNIFMDLDAMRAIWKAQTNFKVTTVSNYLIHTLDSFATTKELRDIYLELIEFVSIGVEYGAKSIHKIKGEQFKENVNIAITSSSGIHIEFFSDDVSDIEFTFKMALSYLRSMKLTQELNETLRKYGFNIDVEVVQLRSPGKFEYYMESCSSLKETLCAAFSYINDICDKPQAIIFGDSTKLCIDPNMSNKFQPFIQFKDHTLYVYSPRYVMFQGSEFVSSILANNTETLQCKNNLVLFEPVVLENELCVEVGDSRRLILNCLYYNNEHSPDYLIKMAKQEFHMYTIEQNGDQIEVKTKFEYVMLNKNTIGIDITTLNPDLRYRCELGYWKQSSFSRMRFLEKYWECVTEHALYSNGLFRLGVYQTCKCNDHAPKCPTTVQKKQHGEGVPNDFCFKRYAGGVIFEFRGMPVILCNVMFLDPKSSPYFIILIKSRAAQKKVFVRAVCAYCGQKCQIPYPSGTCADGQWLVIYEQI